MIVAHGKGRPALGHILCGKCRHLTVCKSKGVDRPRFIAKRQGISTVGLASPCSHTFPPAARLRTISQVPNSSPFYLLSSSLQHCSTFRLAQPTLDKQQDSTKAIMRQQLIAFAHCIRIVAAATCRGSITDVRCADDPSGCCENWADQPQSGQ